VQLTTYELGAADGEAVVCLHGVTGHGRRFAPLARRLAGHRVVGVDLRGHGASTFLPPWSIEQHLADLVETAAALGLDRAVWVGHSFGGRLVSELAAAHPERVERAVLLDPALHIEPEVALERAEVLRSDISFSSPDEAIEARLADGSLFSTPRALLEEEAALHLEQGPDGRFRWRFSAPAVIAAWSGMASPQPPWPLCATLLVTGERSWITLRVPRLATIRHVIVPGGHSILWDDFDAAADAIAAFLATQS
jgi:lipase